jgi:protein-tyrosine phosphatase
MKKILFVCTGNVFRSMTAEKSLEHYLNKNKISGFEVDSAGIKPFPQEPLRVVIQKLSSYGIEFPKHKYKKLTQELIGKNDIIIAMNKNHQEFIKEKFKVQVPLFNEIVSNSSEGVLDIEEKIPHIFSLPKEKKEKIRDEYASLVVDYIYKSIPKLMANLNKKNYKRN